MSSDAIIASCLLHANTSPDCVDGSLVVAAYVGCFCQYLPLGEKTTRWSGSTKRLFSGLWFARNLGESEGWCSDKPVCKELGTLKTVVSLCSGKLRYDL